MPTGLFSQDQGTATVDKYFRLWNAVVVEANVPDFPLLMGQAITTEMFSPPLFAGLCSPNLLIAAERISQFKCLLGPFRREVHHDDKSLNLTFECLAQVALPPTMGAAALIFWVQFGRMATRARLEPHAVFFAFTRCRKHWA